MLARRQDESNLKMNLQLHETVQKSMAPMSNLFLNHPKMTCLVIYYSAQEDLPTTLGGKNFGC
jgi:hypothetical protein